MNILFMCVANSARSQMAEGLAKQLLPNATVKSAGSNPSKVNPLAMQAMQEIGIDLKDHYSKSVEDLSPSFLVQLDYVITLCAEEVCPTLVSKAKKLHWPLPDPAIKEGTETERFDKFRRVRDQLKSQLENWEKEDLSQKT